MAADGDYAPYHNHTENSHQKCENGTEEKTPPFPLFQTLFIRQDGVLGGHGGLLHWGWGGEGQQAGHVIHGSSKRKVVSVLGLLLSFLQYFLSSFINLHFYLKRNLECLFTQMSCNLRAAEEEDAMRL